MSTGSAKRPYNSARFGFPAEVVKGWKPPNARRPVDAPTTTPAQIDAAIARAKALPLPARAPKPKPRRPLSGIRRVTPPKPSRFVPASIPVEHILRGIETRGLRRLVNAVAAYHRVTPGELLGSGRTRQQAWARQSLWVELRALGWSTPEIGTATNRDHTSVLSGVRAATARGYVAQFGAEALPPVESADVGPMPPAVLPDIPDLVVPRRVG